MEITESTEVTETAETIEETEHIPEGGAPDGDPAAMPTKVGEPDGGHPSGADGSNVTTDVDPAAMPTKVGEPDGEKPETGGAMSFSAEELFQEITKLKERLDHAEKERSRIAGEIAEFRTLYPDVSPDSLSASVWDAFSRGVPLAASFALEERYRTRAAELVKATDERNRESASPSAGRSVPTGFYSPEEVRAMSSLEVRTHYAAILDSMKHWDR